MKTTITGAVLAAALLAAASTAQAGDVTVELTGAQARPGKVYSTLSTRETMFREGGRNVTSDAADGTVTVTFSDVPPGDYAFMAFHDENEDQRMGMSPTGMPSEGWALSNGDQLMGPPTFEVLKFAVPAEGTTIQVPLNYSTDQ
jgi:uncharacterized protein (DUF2141 family)